jgi:dephospho-CoA kinase
LKWIGLTGGIASGKSTVANGLRSRGYKVLDADELARRVVAPGSIGLKKIVQVFGPELLTKTGELDRAKLGALIFANPLERQKIEQITHPLVRELSLKERQRLESEGHQSAFYDVPLLFEKNLDATFDFVLLVVSDEKNQRLRMAKRNGFNPVEIDQRLRAQLKLKDKIPRAQYVIINDGTLAELETAIDRFIKQASLPRP